MADKSYKTVIIGGGPAGLAAASSAVDSGLGAGDVLVIERDNVLGGILNQCIHNGFGLHTFGEELTGPEYAQRFEDKVKERHIPCLLSTIVVDISTEDGKTAREAGREKNPKKIVSAMNRTDGFFTVEADTVILAMGCRERPRGALNIPGYRPAGIYTAGTAQRFVNIEGKMPGRKVVILGSGDIGLIMARRMTLEGAHVACVAELMPYSGGLKRNIVQCLDDFGIPLLLSHTVVRIEGQKRVEAVVIAEVDGRGKPIPGTEVTYPCDTLLLSVGLIPENELSLSAGVELSPVTRGPVVNEILETNIPGIFAAGNVLHVHDLVDYVSQEAAVAGRNAAAFVAGNLDDEVGEIPLVATDGIRYTVPQSIDPSRMADELVVRFRVGNVYENRYISVYFDDERVKHLKRSILAPGEMEQVKLKKAELAAKPGLKTITFKLEEA